MSSPMPTPTYGLREQTPAARYSARLLANGDAAVLEPDGLTWVTWFREPATAARYADRLNAWLDSFPLPDELVPIHEAFTAPAEPPAAAELERQLVQLCARLAGPDDVRLPAAELER